MTVHEAAALIGCSARHVRLLCKNGTLKATRRKQQSGFCYSVSRDSATEYSQAPQRKGWERGKSRTK